MEAVIYALIPALILLGFWIAGKIYAGDRWADRRKK